MRMSAVGMGWCFGQRSSFAPNELAFVGDGGDGVLSFAKEASSSELE
jgi:hypothetical protein